MFYLISALLSFSILVFSPLTQAASHNPQEFLASIKGTKDEGEKIVEQFCSNCHALKPLIELGAPKAQQISDWGPRLEQGLSKLFQSTSDGINAMPPRGGCFECTDKQLKLAIIALLPLEALKDQKMTLKFIEKTNS